MRHNTQRNSRVDFVLFVCDIIYTDIFMYRRRERHWIEQLYRMAGEVAQQKYPLKTFRKSFTHNFHAFHSICICIEKSAVNSNCSRRWSYDNMFTHCYFFAVLFSSFFFVSLSFSSHFTSFLSRCRCIVIHLTLCIPLSHWILCAVCMDYEQDERQTQAGQKWKLPPNGQPICSFSGNEKQSRTAIRPEDDSKRLVLILFCFFVVVAVSRWENVS